MKNISKILAASIALIASITIASSAIGAPATPNSGKGNSASSKSATTKQVSAPVSGIPAATPTAKANANDRAAFWTSDKIKNAIAFDMVFQPGATKATRVPVAKQNTGGSSGTSTLGQRWTNSTALVANASGKVFFSIGSQYYVCSGSLVKDGKTDRAIVLTAGHCVFDNASQAYVTNFIFITNYDLTNVSVSGCATATTCWPANALVANPGFTGQTAYTTQATWYDWGFATIKDFKNGMLADGGTSATDGSNSFPLVASALGQGTFVYAFGYPQAAPYTGQYLIYSSGKISFDSRNGNRTYQLASDLTGGASGGPWLSAFAFPAGSAGTLSSVNSYKYGTQTYMYGPKFNTDTTATLNQAFNN